MKPIILVIGLSLIGPAAWTKRLYEKGLSEDKIEGPQKKEIAAPGIKKPHQTSPSGNLPSFYLGQSQISEDISLLNPSQKPVFRGTDIKIGEVLKGRLQESIIAFSDSRVPIRAIIDEGKERGSILLGESYLEKASKRILIDFKKLRLKNSDKTFQVQAHAQDLKGILGIEGKVVSNTDKYFAAEILSAMAAGFIDASVSRSPNAMGNNVEAPGLDTITKKAAASALSESTKHFAEKLKTAPEYVYLEGPLDIQLLIVEAPKTTD